MAFNISFTTSALNQAANLLGINNWQLQTAKFAGVSFFIVPSSLAKFNPLQPEIQIINQIFNDSDTNDALSPNTALTMNNIKDIQTRKLSLYQLPNYDGFVINDKGSNGIIYECTGLFIGDDYLTAINNIQNTANTQSSTGYEFVHPIYGILNNCYCQQFQWVYNYNEWKAATYNIRIIQEGTRNVTNTKRSIPQILSQTLSDINLSINAINNLSSNILLANSIITNIIPKINLNNSANTQILPNITSIDPSTISTNISVSTSSTAQILNSATTLVYQQLIYTQVSNYSFANAIVDYNNLPPMYRYATIKPIQFDNLLQYYAVNVDASINIYEQYGLDTIFNNDITTLKTSLSQFDTLLKTILSQIEQTFTTYTVPYTMSFRTLFFLNNLDFNNANLITTFIETNINVLNDLNVINKDIVLTLPKGV